MRWLVGDDADGSAAHADEADHDVLGIVLVHREKLAVVGRPANQPRDVVGLVRVGGDEGVELGNLAVERIVASDRRRLLGVV